MSYRKLADRYHIAKKTLCKIVNSQTAKFKNNFKITEYFIKQLNYSGNLVLDGKYVPVKEEIETHLLSNTKSKGKVPRSKKRQKVIRGKVLIWGADYLSHDILHFEFDDSENALAFDSYFRKLKSINYPLKSVTVDDKQELIRAVGRHFPNCIIQLCTRHYLKKVSRILGIGMIKIKIRSKEKQIERLFDGEDSTYIPTTRFRSIKLAAQLINEIAELEFKYELLIDFQNIVESIIYASEYKIAEYRFKSLTKYFWPRRFRMREQFDKSQVGTIKKLASDFKEHKKYLLSYLKYPHLNIPRTNNLIEGYNSQLELRLNSIKGFETINPAENYLNVWIVKRRFSKFTDCKKQFKSLNGKTPLECAGADISDIRDWVEFSQN